MNTLQSNSLQNVISSWENLSTVTNSICDAKSFPLEVEGLQSSLCAFFIREIISKKKLPSKYLVVVPTERDAHDFTLDMKVAAPNIDVNYMPWWGIVPYRCVPKGSSIFAERASVLSKLVVQKSNSQVFLTTQRAFMSAVPKPEYIKSLVFEVKKGDSFDPIAIAARLTEQGYLRVPRVTVRGEFTLRGEVLDIFMSGEQHAHRIVFDFDKVEQIKTFDAETQNSTGEQSSLIIYPMKELLWNDQMVSILESKFNSLPEYQFNKNSPSYGEETDETFHQNLFFDEKKRILEELYVNHETLGEELFFSEIFEKSYSLIDYLDTSDVIVYIDYDRQNNAQESLEREYTGLYRKAKVNQPVPSPQKILYKFDSLVAKHKERIVFRTLHTKLQQENKETGVNVKLETDPPRSFFGNIQYLKESINSLLEEDWQIFIFADSQNQALRVKELLRDFQDSNLIILPETISSGFGIPEKKIIAIQENEIFGRRKHIPKSVKHVKSTVIDTFVELNPGDFVVHVNYGIGLFKGIERVKALGNERDYIKLEYADEEIVFIPIEQVNLVQRYIGNEGLPPRLDRLGSKNWESRKNRARVAAEDIARKLIDLYSRRKAARGFPFPKDTEWQTAFEAAFPYTETDDQLTVTAEVKEDMEKPVPMDRLICGDVGYGKTEIAMRAAFKAVMGGKQVAFLAPTTILAEQHYETCQERFENFPVKIAHMSRFVSKQEQKNILEKLSNGKIDILIGTHRIIQKDIIFKDLGLLIIDEEQRFGVKDKEKLKELKNNVDCIAMSATPIPRTLHMSLLKIRDMSLLTTPPQNRRPIETVIDSYNDERVAMAIRREAERGGQVFYLHNRIESLEEVRFKLEQLVPEMLVDVAHGQMSATELDDIFRRFKLGGFHVLVSTTIIENGIDIPNVNTIIIDRADMYGVSQLYQLRGRVGRSDKKAYAYLLYPENKSLSEIAMKRLQVISDFTELGSGFKIAMKDMEIRGAGNLLGKDQSGEIFSVGFDLYLKLLEEAIQRLTEENYQVMNEVLLELEYTGFIPDSYITSQQTKMEIYKKIASISDKDTLERIYTELNDRFGPVPDEVYSLLAIAEIRIICRKLSISTLKERQGKVTVEFSKVADISVDKVLRLIKESGSSVKLDPTKPNILILESGKIGLKEKSLFIREKLESLLV
ncbi:MAG: transcription-repair coupling factor [Spirochaetaceae bacterium]|nr:transcription-repair coupling factor [Spirochaetaceae bacterium]